jgi:hypothetical protein
MKTINHKFKVIRIFSLFISVLVFCSVISNVYALPNNGGGGGGGGGNGGAPQSPQSGGSSGSSGESASDLAAKSNAIAGMTLRQQNADQAFADIKGRIDAMIKNDPRRDYAKSALSTAEKAKNDFIGVDPESNLSTDPYRPNDKFNNLEKIALSAISDVNSELLAPAPPASVPRGDIINDFIPGLIRILFRFSALAIFVSFLVSGVMFIIAFGVEERVTHAKHILYYTLIGFAFITLAFAIVKAVTNIDFFGFI